MDDGLDIISGLTVVYRTHALSSRASRSKTSLSYLFKKSAADFGGRKQQMTILTNDLTVPRLVDLSVRGRRVLS
jgi:hypothetical protein